MPQLHDDCFSNTLILICEHSAEGCMGLIINKQSDLQLDQAFSLSPHEKEQLKHQHYPSRQNSIYSGGPVSDEQCFVLHSDMNGWRSTATISENLLLTSSHDIIEAIALGQGPKTFLICRGYAGWSAGQLELELRANAWLPLAADNSIIFDTESENKLNAATARLGIDLNLIAPEVGNA